MVSVKNIFQISFLISVVGIVGCQTLPYQGQARNVKKKPHESGIIAIPVDARNEDRAKAEEIMRQNCDLNKYRVIEEGEVVVGQKTDSNGSTTKRESNKHEVGNFLGLPVVAGEAAGADSRTSTATSAIKEWQISYDCEISAKVKK